MCPVGIAPRRSVGCSCRLNREGAMTAMAQILPILGLPEIGTVRCARRRTTDVRVALRNEADADELSATKH